MTELEEFFEELTDGIKVKDEAETEEINCWEFDPVYECLREVKAGIDRRSCNSEDYRLFVMNKSYGKWVVAESYDKTAILRGGYHFNNNLKIYNSLNEVLDAYKGRESTTFVYQIGTSNIGSINHVISKLISGEFDIALQPIREEVPHMPPAKKPKERVVLEGMLVA